MAKITQEISLDLDVTDVNGDDVHMIITIEEAKSLYEELMRVLNVTGFSYSNGVRSANYGISGED
jgi:REP element-mobilizing transposase RayT